IPGRVLVTPGSVVVTPGSYSYYYCESVDDGTAEFCECVRVLNGLEMLVGLDLQAGYGLDLVLNKVVEMISCTSKATRLGFNYLLLTMSSIFYVRSTLTQAALDAFFQKYHIPDTVHPELPSPNQSIHDSPDDVLEYFHINMSQLSVIATAKVSHFEILCRVHGYVPTIGLFCSFFWVDESVFPLFVSWYTKKKVTRDPSPTADEFSAEASDFLATHQAPFWKFPKSFLCLVGISRYYELDDNVYPVFLTDDDEEIAFINHADPTKVRIGKKQIEEGQVPFAWSSTRGDEGSLTLLLMWGLRQLLSDSSKGVQDERKAAEGIGFQPSSKKIKRRPSVPPTLVLVLVGNMLLCFRAYWNAVLWLLKSVLRRWLRSNVADAEVSSIVRSLVLDPPIMTTTVATKVIVDTSSVPVPKAGNEPVYHTLFADSAATGEARHDITACFPVFFSQLRGMDYDQLFTEFNFGAARQHMSLKEAKAAEAIRLRGQVAAVEAAKGDRANELDGLKARNLVHEGKRLSSDELNVKAASLESQKDNLASQDEHVKILSDKVAGLDAELMGMALHMDEEFYSCFQTTIAGQRWILICGLKLVVMNVMPSSQIIIFGFGRKKPLALYIDKAYDPFAKANYVSVVHALRGLDFPLLSQLKIKGDVTSHHLSLSDVMVPLIKPLSVENLVGEASTVCLPATAALTTVFSTTFAQTSYVPSILVLDYDVLDAEPQTKAPTFALVASKRSKSSCDGRWIAKYWITCVNTNGNTTLSEAQGVSLRITSGVRDGRGLAQKLVNVEVSHDLRGDCRNCVPRTLPWWESLSREGECRVASNDLRDALSVIFGLSVTQVVMSADSAVTYTFVHSEARSWSIPSKDPYEDAVRQLLEQALRSLEYLPNPMELEDHPLSADASPTALSPGYIADSDLEEDKEDPEEDPSDHPADG
ncbi:hypothetical protein Tco_1569864, partial [Tanacetum coccineum]